MKIILPFLSLLLLAAPAAGQDTDADAATVTYPATYFEQYAPVSVNDMLNRIPGIGLALEGEQIPRLRDQQERGLGGSDQILINGKRLAGKANEARAQLDRIAASQVDYIEIVRNTSGNLDVQNAGQLVNIVLLESLSSTSISSEVGLTHYHDGSVEPAGSISVGGRRGALNYLLSADVKPGYEALESFELSLLPDLSLNETRTFDRYRDQTIYTVNSNIVYEPTAVDRIAVNGLYSEGDPSTRLLRTITNLRSLPNTVLLEREAIPAAQDNWEFGGDYQHNFANGARFKMLFIVNERNNVTTRERFVSVPPSSSETKNLFLDSRSRYRERIGRGSYTWNLRQGQNLELGIERAQTIQDSALRLGGRAPGTPSPDYGGLVPVFLPNAVSTVEEIRYEGFAVHNWQIDQRMSLESSLMYEVSEIAQTGDVSRKRDFDFIKPKVDFRYNISSSLQLRMSLEKDVSQLSFADFSANVNERDEDQDTIAGNPELEQEQTWRYVANLDYRLPNDGGVVNTRIFHYDVSNVIDRIDISPSPSSLASTIGNVGDGTVYGIDVNVSSRLGFIGLPQAVLTGGVLVQESSIDDPMIARERRVVPFDRGNFRIGFRHELPARSLSYGFNYRDGFDGNRPFWDVDNVIYIGSQSTLNLFAEKVGFAGFTYRFEAENLLDHESCRERRRYTGYLRNGNLKEIERYCTTVGTRYIFKIRANF